MSDLRESEIAARLETTEPWQQGRTLQTRQTRAWSQAQWDANELRESRMVFVGFSDRDAGRSREVVAEARTPELARAIVRQQEDIRYLLTELSAARKRIAMLEQPQTY